VVVIAMGCGSLPPRCNRSGANVDEQVGDGDDVVAMRAGSSGAKPMAEYAALVTPLLTEEACFALGALIDDH
jgi:hypothetical protein